MAARQGIIKRATAKRKNRTTKYTRKASYSYGQVARNGTVKTVKKKSLKYTKKISKNGKTKYYYS